jgi:hypothetical protein
VLLSDCITKDTPPPFKLPHTTFGYTPGRIARIDCDDRDAGECRLIGDEPPELVERPSFQAAALDPIDRCPRRDVREVFNPDGRRDALALATSRLLMT